MKTYKAKYLELEIENRILQNHHNNLCEEYGSVIKKALADVKIENKDVGVMQNIVDILNDIRKNGGGYSSAKASEILYMFGELK